MVRFGIDERSRSRGKEEFIFLLFPRVWNAIELQGWKGSKIGWAMGENRNSEVCIYLCFCISEYDKWERKRRESFGIL